MLSSTLYLNRLYPSLVLRLRKLDDSEQLARANVGAPTAISITRRSAVRLENASRIVGGGSLRI